MERSFQMKITKNEFGMTKDNQPISLYTIENASGASVTLSDYGMPYY